MSRYLMQKSLFDVPRVLLYKYDVRYLYYNVEGVGGALGRKWGHICVLKRTLWRGSYFERFMRD